MEGCGGGGRERWLMQGFFEPLRCMSQNHISLKKLLLSKEIRLSNSQKMCSLYSARVLKRVYSELGDAGRHSTL